MENNYIYDFLSLKSENDEKRLMKTWLGLLISFTVVFMDIGFWVLFHLLCKREKWHKIQNCNRAGKSRIGLPPIIAY